MNRIIYGFHAVTARIRSDASTVTEVFLDAARQDGRVKDLRELAESKGIRVMTVDARRLDGMAAGQRHQGVAANVQVKALSHSLDDILDAATEPALVLVLDGVTDPHNLGACLRVADAAGAHAVVAPKDKAAGLSATVVKVASGAAEYIPYIMVTNLARTLRELKERAIWVVGADSEASEDLYAAKMPVAVAWVLGAEGDGLRRLTRETCDALVNIPMHGSVASLNVSVASGICLFESRRRRMMS
ncbi:MAG: 23S rRNA (guanosine(2251)-2'-O)-methyltransferase RlmB [Proteobacteria bacterium]|nr:23S rRNA (guanosine(2251)-2'-O)-methyltransferase RlmB [Pseudomonadota bacterium]